MVVVKLSRSHRINVMIDNPIQISFENVGVFRFPESVDEITKKKANCLSKFAFCSINEVRLYFYILLAKLI
ncbi:hypothetical protein BEST7003_2548 [Bacillus subtilis BEST7003]|nr:hypothetical protein AS891_09645 [Bacillus subtilis subsp. subtilis]AQZ91571.1 hypothetical protein B4U62_14470 [Bacillus subtilis]EXF54461.1 hypothetical protein Y647_07645 [Bacillus subtilis QH-1]MDR4254350.1 hypothetical protein [Bacillus subtilis subsp. subtilis NCIB 3610 = ATCC 6051 = DSM 10]MDR4278915.1 hypothetical protein [Bacillus subtilis KCTC 1028 = ATCC 6051a]QDW06402.1 hypothetical protein FFE90_014635 [Bacillus sp. KBS0812]RFB08346.1 hypothetical protein DZB72_03545 [Bacillus